MSATQPIGVDPPRGTSEDAVKRQLDALANGECDQITFLNAMKERFHFEPDDNWEVLSLLDQYYRRGKIPVDVFRAIKNGFAEYILGPQVAMPTLRQVATPAEQPPAPSAKVMPAAAASSAVAAPAITPAPAAAPALTPAPSFTGGHTATVAQSSAAATKANAAPARELRVGDMLRDRYRVEAVLARGGSGTVFEISDAYRLNLPPAGKRLALKAPRLPDARGNLLGQLRHEFHTLQHLSHPNIVRAFDFDRDATPPFFTMEFLSGVHLTQVLQGNARKLPRAHALAIIRDIGSAIAYAHARGVVHGDVNPQNVFITMTGEVRLLGFGAAHKLAAGVPTPDFDRASASSDTQRYASCEVFEGNRPDAQDDIYSLSCVAYLLLKGRHPYADTTSIEARAGRLRPRRPAGLSYQQWRMLRAGLRTDVKKRPATAREWLDAMELGGAAPVLPGANDLVAAPAADKPRRLLLLAAAAVIAALIGVGYWYSISSDTPTFPPLANEPAGEEALPSTASSTLPTPPTAAPPATAPTATAPQAPQRQLPATAPQPIAKPAPVQAASGPTRVEMAVDTLDALPADTVVHVTVRRKGNLHGVTSFTWWTESGTAKPGSDFSPVLPRVEQMQDGESSTVLTVPLISTSRAQEKGFYVGIESTDGGAQIGARALTQITLLPSN
jgi:serine/threonine protein kinase